METTTEKIENTALDKVIKDSGLVLTDAEQIKQSYLPFFNQLAEIKEESKKINFVNPSALDEKIARELRLRTVKVRTGSESVKDDRKKIHMLKADVEQSSWNLIKSTCQLDEEKFAQVEKARERAEAARKAALKIERETILKEFDADVEFVDLANMPEESFDRFLESAKLSQAQRIEAERVAEEERKAKEIAEAEERAKIKAENERLKKEAEEREKAMAKERAKAEAEKKAIEEKAAKERAKVLAAQKVIEDKAIAAKKVADEAAKKLAAENEKALNKIKEEKEKAEAELLAKREAEEKSRLEAEAKAEAELNKGDKQKVLDLLSDLEMLKYKYKFTTVKYKKISAAINELLEKTIVYSKSKV